MYENLRFSFCMKTTNMASARSCLYILLLVNLHFAFAKPFFGLLFCDMLCVDYDDDDVSTSASSTTTSMEDYLMDWFDPCTGCPTNRPRTPRPPTTPPPFGPMPPFGPNGPIWPGGPMNGTMNGPNGMWWWFVGQGSPPPIGTPNPGASSAPPAATTAASATTAAPGATTAAPTTTAAP